MTKRIHPAIKEIIEETRTIFAARKYDHIVPFEQKKYLPIWFTSLPVKNGETVEIILAVSSPRGSILGDIHLSVEDARWLHKNLGLRLEEADKIVKSREP